MRGSRLLDRRPPHYRCPAVPGLCHSARAILMALGPSVLSLWDQLTAGTALPRTAGDATCSVTCHSATLRQPAPSPVLRLLWLGTPLPNFPVRAPAADAFTEEPLTDFTAGSCELHLQVLPLHQLRSCSRRPLITASHPVRSSAPSPSRNNPGFGTPPPHRPAHSNYLHYCLAVRVCRALPISATRETIARRSPNVYFGQHRFLRVRRRASRTRTTTAEGPGRVDRLRARAQAQRTHRTLDSTEAWGN
jgi:hypothetical protein